MAVNYVLISNDGRRYPIGPEGLTLGSYATNQVVVEDPVVSSHHARILFSQNRCWIRDENSATGTYIDGRRVLGQQELLPGQVLQIGSATFQLASSEPVAGAAAVATGKRSPNPLVFVGIFAVVAIILLLAFSGVFTSSGDETPTATQETSETQTDTPTPSTTPTVSVTPTLTATESAQSIGFDAEIDCESENELLAEQLCLVTNTGSSEDTLWLAFEPYESSALNGFRISVIIEESEDRLEPDENGRVSLGDFASGQARQITIRMICLPGAGCNYTAMNVSLLANSGTQEISDLAGRVTLKNEYKAPAVVTTAAPNEEEPPGEEPTATQSDGFGPTDTPQPYP